MPVSTALLAGLIFGLGLTVSGMVNPSKVLGFLDISSAWDPSLAFVMAGAILIAAPAFSLARQRSVSLMGAEMKLPVSGQIDRRLVLGSLLFGTGWGMAGFCPGPGLVALAIGQAKAIVFVIAMLAGMSVSQIAVKTGTRFASR